MVARCTHHHQRRSDISQYGLREQVLGIINIVPSSRAASENNDSPNFFLLTRSNAKNSRVSFFGRSRAPRAPFAFTFTSASDHFEFVEDDSKGPVAKVGVRFSFLGDQRENETDIFDFGGILEGHTFQSLAPSLCRKS
jgi:hypothetical protein